VVSSPLSVIGQLAVGQLAVDNAEPLTTDY